ARALKDVGAVDDAAGDGVGGILVLAVRNVPCPVLPGEVATHHPAVGEALVEGEGGSLELLLVVAVLEEEAVARADPRAQLIVVDGVGPAVGGGLRRGVLLVVAAPVQAADAGK